MGTYYINAAKEEILTLIEKFASEEKIGKLKQQEQKASYIKLAAPARFDFSKTRYRWILKENANGISVSFKLRPSVLKLVGFYTSFVIIGYALLSLGLCLLVEGVRVINLSLLAVLAGLGLILLWFLKFTRTKDETLRIEQCFFDRLKHYRVRIDEIPDQNFIPFSALACLVYIPLIVAFIGLLCTLPLIVILCVPLVALNLIHNTIQRYVKTSPWASWRIVLLGWVERYVGLCYAIFIGFTIFNVFGIIMLATVDENITSSQELILRSFNPLLWITQQGSVSKTILAENVAVVQKILVITKLSYEKTTLMLKLFRVFSLSSAVVMLIWAMKNFISWFNSWLLLHPDSKATLSPPPTSARTSSKLNIVVRFSICLSLLLAAISNFFHFLLTAEILSVVFFNHRAISFPVAQTIGWVAINLDAAIQGNVSKSTVGIALLIAFTLPTMIIMLTWICFLVSQVIKLFETEPTEQKNKCGLTPKNCTSIN